MGDNAYLDRLEVLQRIHNRLDKLERQVRELEDKKAIGPIYTMPEGITELHLGHTSRRIKK